MLKVCILGIGGIGEVHISAWKKIEGAEIAGICDVRPERLEKYPKYRSYISYEDMIAAERPDILDICLPTYMHADYSVDAMKRGIHVICEKPISLNVEDVCRVYNTAKENNVKFMVAQVLRFWPAYELIKELYDTQKYGKLLSGSMKRVSAIPTGRWEEWMQSEEKSGLVPFDLHIHDLDFLVWAFGRPVSESMYRTKCKEQDSLAAVYKYDGFYVNVESAWYAAQKYPFSATCRFQFEHAVVEYGAGKVLLYLDDGSVLDSSACAEDGVGALQLPKTEAYMTECKYFADCVINDKEPDKVKAQELTDVLLLLAEFN